MNKEIKTVSKSPNKQKPRTRWPHWWILPNIKESTPVFLKLIPKTEKVWTFQIYFIQPPLPWYQRQTRTLHKKKISGQYSSWKDPDAGKDRGQEKKETTEDVTVGWHQQLNGHGSGWTPGVGDGQGGLTCCDSWGHKESDTTEQLIWSDLILTGVRWYLTAPLICISLL